MTTADGVGGPGLILTTALGLMVLGSPAAAWAGCLNFGTPDTGSQCRPEAVEMVWTTSPGRTRRVEGIAHDFDRLIGDPVLGSGVVLSGRQQFRFEGPGTHVVEVFLVEPREGSDSFGLAVDGETVDDRHLQTRNIQTRLRPKESHPIILLGSIRGGQILSIESEARGYVLSAIRWTPTERFERDRVPAALERVRALFRDPFHDQSSARPFARCSSLRQLCALLLLSRDPETRREASVGLARATYWLAVENQEPHDIRQAHQAMQKALAQAPDDDLLGEMISASCLATRQGRTPILGEDLCPSARPRPWSVEIGPPPPGAPAWAVAQRRLTKRMEAITGWWVRRRQQADGAIGGGWGDDVEILRVWGPQAVGLGSEVAATGLRRIADGVWNSGRLLDGYDRRISDVEHSSEPSTDTVPLRVVVSPHDGEARGRLAQTARCAPNWILPQPDGHWRFAGSWFNCTEFDPRPERALDVHLNTRAVGPALWDVYLTRDPKIIDLLQRWGASWVEAMRSSAHGKPPGLFPPAIRSANGAYLIGSDRWDEPSAEWDYFHWSGSAQESLTSLLLALFDLTRDDKWLEAAGQTFQVLDACAQHQTLCSQIVRTPQAFLEWRRLSGDSRYDGHFRYSPESDARTVFLKARQLALQEEARLAVNFRMRTSEAIFTDRVDYTLPFEYRRLLFGGEAPRGDRYPAFAVTWPPIEGELARLVTATGATELGLALFNFEKEALEIPVRLWRLPLGVYRWTMRDAKGDLIQDGRIRLAHRPQTAQFQLPPQREVHIRFTLDR